MRGPSSSGSNKLLRALELSHDGPQGVDSNALPSNREQGDCLVSSARDYFLMTNRLGFGTWEKDDLALAMALWGDPSVSEFIGGPFATDAVRARLDREIETMIAYGVQYWPVFLLENGELAGCAGLRPYGEEKDILELGFHFRPHYWGTGLAQEAARAVIDFAFATLAVKHLFAGHHPNNIASRRLLKKLGFCFTHEEIYPPTGQLEPAYLLTNPDNP
jgi:[ribosomal protein S5]-alanine N-acetyltransferase